MSPDEEHAAAVGLFRILHVYGCMGSVIQRLLCGFLLLEFFFFP